MSRYRPRIDAFQAGHGALTPFTVRTTPSPGTEEAERVLLHVRYGLSAPADPTVFGQTVETGLAHLAGPAEEWWLSPEPVHKLQVGGLSLRANATVAFGQLQIPENALRADAAAASEAALAQLFDAVAASGYPHLLRTWVYLGHIHRGADDAERYRQFCIGRGRVMESRLAGPDDYPAATVIGRSVGGASLHFIAAKAPGRAVENPRQTSAFVYPRQYGPQPPSFVRALQAPWGTPEATLIVSGTAAVVGHDSCHPGDAQAQALETARNLAALTEAAGGGGWQPRRAVVYLREGVDPAAAGTLSLLPETTVVRGDICRSELLVECEALYGR